jgi:hypothetical protein
VLLSPHQDLQDIMALDRETYINRKNLNNIKHVNFMEFNGIKYVGVFITYLVKLFIIDILRHCPFENLGDDAQLAMHDIEDVRLDM